MPQVKSLPVFLGEEWDRFIDGLKGLNPNRVQLQGELFGRPPRAPGQEPTIAVPGWDSIIKTGPKPQTSGADWGEYFKAKREERPPNLDPSIVAEINRKRAMQAANADSAQPAWSRSVGQVMTAIDNVQDLASTLATFGRLLLWAAPRLGVRAVPIVGWFVLAADLLNLMNFFGMLAMPLYALLCSGPKEALFAGVPAAALKNVLCKEVWTQALRNPFSRTARAARGLKALGRLPRVSNLIEVAQTTDNFIGYGLGLGSLYGMGMDMIFSVAHSDKLKMGQFNIQQTVVSFGGEYVEKARAMDAPTAAVNRQAATVLATSTAIAGKQDLIDDQTHQLHATVLLGAVATVAEFFKGGNHEALFAELLPQPWPAPTDMHPDALGGLAEIPRGQWGDGHWWLPDTPRSVRGDDLVAALGADVALAVRDFIRPRRNQASGAYYGTAVNHLTDMLWTMLSDDVDFLKWELTPDYKLLTGMMVDGRILPASTPETAAWRFWQAAKALLEVRGGELLYPWDLDRLAEENDVTLMKLLSPDAPFPPEWSKWLADNGVKP